MSDQPQVWCYIGRIAVANKRHPIGQVVCAFVDRPEYAKDVRKAVAKWMRDGLTIERVPVEWVRKHMNTQEPYRP